MPKTYTPIATSTMTVNAPSITFSSIPAGYTDLKLVITFKRDNAGGVYLRFNGDSASNYSQTFLEGNASTTTVSVQAANQTFGYIDYNGDSTNNGMYSIDLMNYSNTNTFKTYLATAGNSAIIDKTVGLWRSTAAISTILVASSNGGNYFAGSSATLYGILKA